MKGEIKAIETVYNGYRFRSRLEARWAVFFDKMNVPYEYEAEGYTFPDGSFYLPDFYLPKLNAYVEIKHSEYFHFSQEGDELYFCADNKDVTHKYAYAINNLVDDGHIFILFCGDPYEVLKNSHGALDTNGKGIVFHMDYCLWKEQIRTKQLKPSEVKCKEGKCKGLECNLCLCSLSDFLGFDDNGKIIVALTVNDGRVPKPFTKFNFIITDRPGKTEVTKDELFYNFSMAKKARQARFEHGECG